MVQLMMIINDFIEDVVNVIHVTEHNFVPRSDINERKVEKDLHPFVISTIVVDKLLKTFVLNDISKKCSVTQGPWKEEGLVDYRPSTILPLGLSLYLSPPSFHRFT
jgi:hypothetical protein